MERQNTCERFERFLSIVERLRAPQGCPWDREQTHKSLRPYVIEEVYELVDAIDDDDSGAMCEELGDVLLHVAFHADIRREAGDFSIDDVIDYVTEKLVRRHPHVFENVQVSGTEDVLHNWENIKRAERQQTKKKHASLLDGIPKELSALLTAQRMQEKASRIGFDWDDIRDVWGKVREEFNELEQNLATLDPDKVEDELGDALFALANLARFLNLNAEMALKRTNQKFSRRFRHVEMRVLENNLEKPTLAQMDVFWDEAKRTETR